MDCTKKTKEACKASTKCTYASGKKKSYCKKKNTTKSLCVKKSETKCKRVRGCNFASGTKRKFCRKNVTKRRKKMIKGGVATDLIKEIEDIKDKQKTHDRMMHNYTISIDVHTGRINGLENTVIGLGNRIRDLEN